MHVVDAAARIVERERLADDDRALLLFSALTHDFGKADTTELREKNGRLRWTAHGHAKLGGPLSKTFLPGTRSSSSIVPWSARKIVPGRTRNQSGDRRQGRSSGGESPRAHDLGRRRNSTSRHPPACGPSRAGQYHPACLADRSRLFRPSSASRRIARRGRPHARFRGVTTGAGSAATPSNSRPPRVAIFRRQARQTHRRGNQSRIRSATGRSLQYRR